MVGGVVSTFHAKGLKMISSPPGTGGPSSKLKGVGMQTPHVAWTLSRAGLAPLHAVCVSLGVLSFAAPRFVCLVFQASLCAHDLHQQKRIIGRSARHR